MDLAQAGARPWTPLSKPADIETIERFVEQGPEDEAEQPVPP